MSKDMLGSLVRASVRLSPRQINLTIDFINRLTGQNSEAWEPHLKRVLRSGVASGANTPSLWLIDGNICLGGLESYNPKRLKECRGIRLTAHFLSDIFWRAKPLKNLAPVSLRSYELTEGLCNPEIANLLGGKHLFSKSEVCARIAQMVAKQPNGEEGSLLTDGMKNLFYVRGLVVTISWYAPNRVWEIFSWKVGNDSYQAGTQVFTRN